MQNLLNQFNLGNLIASPEKITLGCSHELYHVTTDHGEYAVKVLAPSTVNFLGGIKQYHHRDELLAQLKQRNIPAVATLYRTDTHFIYPWVSGKIIDLKQISIEHAQTIGKLLATIHQLYLPEHQLTDSPWQFLPPMQESWQDLWKDKPLADLSEQYENKYRAALEKLTDIKVLGHGDLNHLNILWNEENAPQIVDWEAFGLVYPKAELFSIALGWSGFASGHHNPALFQALIAGYEQVLQQPVIFTQVDKDSSLGYWLIWLKFCLYRANQILPTSLEQQQKYVELAKKTMGILKMMVSYL
jgi:Ser/Thr protein kinase RdoA (MazF antagonist)